MRAAVLGVAFLAGACGAPPFRIDRVRGPSGVLLTLTPDPGARVNARLRPALELSDGVVLRFNGTRLTPDSAYFEDAATVTVPPEVRSGLVRASACPVGQEVCRSYTMAVRF